MPDKRHWSATLAHGLADLARRIEQRQAAVRAREAAETGAVHAAPAAASGDDAAHLTGPAGHGRSAPSTSGAGSASGPDAEQGAGPEGAAIPAGQSAPAGAGASGPGAAASRNGGADNRASGTATASVAATGQRDRPADRVSDGAPGRAGGAGRDGGRPGAVRPGGGQRSPLGDPVAVVPWSMRVAAEVAWRLLILAGSVWVLMRVIGAVRLVVLAFVAALLITALLQPFVARLKRMGVPAGLATALVCVGGFVVMGLVGWFVVWQVMDNVDNLSSSLQDGISEGKKWLLNSPFHVTDDQINQVADNLSNALSHNTKQLTDVGLQGVTFIVELLTGILLAMFSTIFLLYDGPNIWNWVLRLFPVAARDGLAGAGPRAWRTLTLYVRGTVIVALIDAICIGVGIFFLGVPMAVPLAVVIFLSSFVPLVGAVASGAIAVVVALVTEGPFSALLVLAVVLAVQQIEGHILQPFILGRAVRVHPLAVVLSVAAGSLVAGIGGAVVAVPLVAVSNTVVTYLRGRTAATAAEAEAAEETEGVAGGHRIGTDDAGGPAAPPPGNAPSAPGTSGAPGEGGPSAPGEAAAPAPAPAEGEKPAAIPPPAAEREPDTTA